MNEGRTLFAQVMDFVPWKTFARIIVRHNGDAGVRTLGCADLFRIMAFSQLTWRESLRDIEVARAAAEILFKKIADLREGQLNESQPAKILFPADLIIRRSCGCPGTESA